jgi:hypothetical protein
LAGSSGSRKVGLANRNSRSGMERGGHSLNMAFFVRQHRRRRSGGVRAGLVVRGGAEWRAGLAWATQWPACVSASDKGLTTPENPRCTSCCTDGTTELSPAVKGCLEVLGKLPFATRARIAAQLPWADGTP